VGELPRFYAILYRFIPGVISDETSALNRDIADDSLKHLLEPYKTQEYKGANRSRDIIERYRRCGGSGGSGLRTNKKNNAGRIFKTTNYTDVHIYNCNARHKRTMSRYSLYFKRLRIYRKIHSDHNPPKPVQSL
jgi:hypothetical protein